ncbi:MAG: alpha/beta hydrolase [Lachnospiraceae bacterium]|nr:alpha/beta hydrolase [Lachnospiraceae bacterium]
MKIQNIEIKAAKDSNQTAGLTCYLHETSKEIAIEKRPIVLICPGGGYAYTSDREADPIALAFLAQGFHAAILRYSCAEYGESDKPQDPSYSVEPEARMQVGRAVALIRENAGSWGIDPDRIVLWGASAGGHLVAHYACTWFDELPGLTGLPQEGLRINGLMLAYPVITSGEKAHRGSFDCLLREKKDDPAELKRVSLEYRVNEHVPPTFIWHTWTDGSVPVENSLYFAQALKEHDINTELHIFPMGGHGLSLADERTVSPWGKEIEPCCQIWIDLACAWLKRL